MNGSTFYVNHESTTSSAVLGGGQTRELNKSQLGKQFVTKSYCDIIKSLHLGFQGKPTFYFSSGVATCSRDPAIFYPPPSSSEREPLKGWRTSLVFGDVIHPESRWTMTNGDDMVQLSNPNENGHRMLVRFREGFQIGALKIHFLAKEDAQPGYANQSTRQHHVDLHRVKVNILAGNDMHKLEQVAVLAPSKLVISTAGDDSRLILENHDSAVRFMCLEFVIAKENAGSDKKVTILNVTAAPYHPTPVSFVAKAKCSTHAWSPLAHRYILMHLCTMLAALAAVLIDRTSKGMWIPLIENCSYVCMGRCRQRFVALFYFSTIPHMLCVMMHWNPIYNA